MENASSSREPVLMVISAFACLPGLGLAIVLIVALRQSAFLLIDIADMLAHHQAAEKN